MTDVAAVVAGLIIVLFTESDVFQSVIVPRAARSRLRLSRYIARGLWGLWPKIAYRVFGTDEDRREDFLGVYAPAYLIFTLAGWVVSLQIGWGLFFYGFRTQLHPANLTFADAVYYAGASFLTIGYGDITAQTIATRLMSIVCAGTGLATMAVVVSFLFSIFGSFQRRETFVVTLGARAGVPPSGVGLLAVHGREGMRSDLAQVFREGQTWTAEVMESHLAYPILVYFRSSHDYESWVGTLGALMDAASLVLSTLDADRLENVQTHGQARIMYKIGRHLTIDFTRYFNLDEDERSVGVERPEFDDACERLRDAGYEIVDIDEAWKEFSKLRLAYASRLNEMARWLEIPPVQWVGDRSILARAQQHVKVTA